MAAKGESVELDALNQNMTSIKSIIKNDLRWFSDELVKRNFLVRREIQAILGTVGITPEEQASKLMDRVYNLIEDMENKRERFDEFVDIFISHGGAASDELVKKLKPYTHHNAAANDGAVVQSSKPSSPQPFSTEKKGPSPNDLHPDPAAGHSSSPLPSPPTPPTPPRVPPLRSSPPPIPPSLADRVDQTTAEIDRLGDDFSSLMSSTRDELCKKESSDLSFLDRFRDRLMDLPIAQNAPHNNFFKINVDDILKAKNICKLIAILRRYCNYRNYEILKVVVRKFCKVLKQRMDKYCVSLENFERATTVDVYLFAEDAGDVLRSEFIRLTVKINKQPSECTLYEIRKVTRSMQEQASLHLYSVYIGSPSEGSVQVELGIHPDCVGRILAVLDPQFLQSHHLSDVCLGPHQQQMVMRRNEHQWMLNEELLSASKSGDLMEVTSLLNSGADVQTMDRNGETPLFKASKRGHQQMVYLLTGRGSTVDSRDKDPWPDFDSYSEGIVSGPVYQTNLVLDTKPPPPDNKPSPTQPPVPKSSPTQPPVPKSSPTEPPVPKSFPNEPPVPKSSPTQPPVPKSSPTEPPVPKSFPNEPPVPKYSPNEPPVPKSSPNEPPVPKSSLTEPPVPKSSPNEPPVPKSSPTEPPVPKSSPTEPPVPKSSPTEPPVPKSSLFQSPFQWQPQKLPPPRLHKKDTHYADAVKSKPRGVLPATVSSSPYLQPAQLSPMILGSFELQQARPGSLQPQHVRPVLSQPQQTRPGSSQPWKVIPGSYQVQQARPGLPQSQSIIPGPYELQQARPAPSQPQQAWPDPAQGQPIMLGSLQPQQVRPSSFQPQQVTPVLSQPQQARPGLFQPWQVIPDSYQVQQARPGSSQSQPIIPGSSQSQPMIPGPYELQLARPDPAQGQQAWPDPAHGQPIMLGSLQPQQVRPGSFQPQQITPVLSQPQQARPGSFQPWQVIPDSYQVQQARPGLPQSQPMIPGSSQLQQARPGTSQPQQAWPGPAQGQPMMLGSLQPQQVRPGLSQPQQAWPGMSQGQPMIPGLFQRFPVPGMLKPSQHIPSQNVHVLPCTQDLQHQPESYIQGFPGTNFPVPLMQLQRQQLQYTHPVSSIQPNPTQPQWMLDPMYPVTQQFQETYQERSQHMPKEWAETKVNILRQKVCDETTESSNYFQKFHTLLLQEEDAHAIELRKRCDNKYKVSMLQAGQKPGCLRQGTEHLFYRRHGYIEGMDGDNISYVAQSASSVVIELEDETKINCDITAENLHHTEERLYIGFDNEAAQGFLSHYNPNPGTKGPAFSSVKLSVKFKLKSSYFNSLQSSISNLGGNEYIISRIVPQRSDFKLPNVLQSYRSTEEYKSLSTDDQSEALRKIASAPPSGPPILISGPFGTGKTHVLAFAAHQSFLHHTTETQNILVCTQMQTSADAYLETYRHIESGNDRVRIVRLVPDHYYIRGIYARNVNQFKKEMDHNLHRHQRNQQYLIITTCLTAKKIADVIPPGFFTHIFLDEGAQMREPEAVAPLSMAGPNTKIVIAGDKFQVGPAMLVLGDKPQRDGLAVSLLERLHILYHKEELKEVAKPYCANLSTNFRCHRGIINLARQVAYKAPLHCKVPDDVAHPKFPFPLRFICTSLDHEITETKESICEIEVDAAIKEASYISVCWPLWNWEDHDLRQICFLSPCRRQVTIARRNMTSECKHIQMLATYNIQGREFRALFISTSEPTDSNSETKDPTKSISDPSVFITAITRARSLVVAVGNPFMLLKREEHMVKKFGDRGHCWSRFLNACIEKKTFSVYPGVAGDTLARHHLLKKKIDICLSEDQAPEQDNITSILSDSERLPKSPSIPKIIETEVSAKLPESHVYEYGDKLGEGAFGVVYSAQPKQLKNEVERYAIKIVRILEGPDREKKVMREVHALKQFMEDPHPNILNYYDSWKETAPPNWPAVAPWNLGCVTRLLSSSKMSRDSRSVTKPTQSFLSPSSQDSGIWSEASSASTMQRLYAKKTGRLLDESSRSLTRDSGIEGESSSTSMKLKSPIMESVQPGAMMQQVPPRLLFIKTELCQKTLKWWLDKKESHERKKVASLFIEMLQGVKYIHGKGLIHRDLKPSNIFFSLNGWKIKIGDFGQVTNAQDADYDYEEATPMTQSHYVGTQFYISPEQKNRERYGKEVDIYALGVIYFEMNCPFQKQRRDRILTDLCESGIFPKRFEDNLHHEANIIREMMREKDTRPSAEILLSSTSMKRLKKISRKSRAMIPSAMY